MSSKLLYFLVAMSENLEIQREFRRNANRVMKRYGLSPKEIAAVNAAVKTGHEGAIRTLVDDDFEVRCHLQVYPKPPKPPRKSKK